VEIQRGSATLTTHIPVQAHGRQIQMGHATLSISN